jgi:hypothetical protein
MWSSYGLLILIVVLPLLGILIYMIVQPKMTEQDKRMMDEMQAQKQRAAGYSATDEIAKAAELKDKGAISFHAQQTYVPRESLEVLETPGAHTSAGYGRPHGAFLRQVRRVPRQTG